jgi:hypothetical protein
VQPGEEKIAVQRIAVRLQELIKILGAVMIKTIVPTRMIHAVIKIQTGWRNVALMLQGACHGNKTRNARVKDASPTAPIALIAWIRAQRLEIVNVLQITPQ